MKKQLQYAIFIASYFLLSACVAPQTKGVYVDQQLVDKERAFQFELSLKKQLQYQRKLDNAVWPIYQAATPICDYKFHQVELGIDAMVLEDFPEEYRPAAKKIFSIDKYMQVISVAAGSPADKAGIQSGDKIKTLNGLNVSLGNNASKRFSETMEDALLVKPSVELGVERKERLRNIKITGEKLCYFPAYLSMDDAVNAYADGKNIVITKGMLRFVETDLELAAVLAHELGHNMMSHIDARKSNYWLGTLADIAAAVAGVNTQGSFGQMGARAYSQDFESEADYVSVYILAQANMDIDKVANFWRRMAAEHPGGIKENHGASHPSTPQRFSAIEKTVQEIRIKQKAGFSLQPDRR